MWPNIIPWYQHGPVRAEFGSRMLTNDSTNLARLQTETVTPDIRNIRGIAWLFIPALTGTLYLNHNDHGKLYCSTSQNLSSLDLKLFSDGLSITSAGIEF